MPLHGYFKIWTGHFSAFEYWAISLISHKKTGEMGNNHLNFMSGRELASFFGRTENRSAYQ